MARPLRIEYEGACHHVMNRGNARRRVFHGDDDYALFLDKLGRAVETFRVSLRAVASWVSLDALIARVAEAFDAAPAHLLRRWSRNNTGRQVLLHVACRHCRGRYSLTELAERLGGITVGSLSRSRQLMEQRLARDRALRGTVARLEQTLRAGSERHDT